MTHAELPAGPAPRARVDLLLACAFALLAAGSLLGMGAAAAAIPGGADRIRLLGWTGVIALLVAVLAWRLRPAERLAPVLARRAGAAQAALVLALLLVIPLVQARVFQGMPQFPDSFAELFQARILAAGRLWLPAPGRPDLVRIANVVDHAGRWYAQYPIGNPALLSLGLRTGFTWLPAALIGLLLATGLRALARESVSDGAASLALLLALASPMLVLAAAAGMSQATLAALAAWALALALGTRRHARGRPDAGAAVALEARPARFSRGLVTALGGGLITGLAGTVRPLDGVVLAAVSLPVVAAPGGARGRRLALWLTGAAVGVAPALLANALTTGSPLRFGYSVLWGAGTLPGFGPRGSGIPFGPLDGLRDTLRDLGGLQLALLEWPLPVLAVLAVALATRRRWNVPVRVLGLYVLAQVAVYFTYFQHDFFYGPRFLLPVVPPLLVLLAEGLARLAAAPRPRGRLQAGAFDFLRELVFVQLAAAALLVAWPGMARAGSRDIAATAALRRASTSAGLPVAAVLVDDGWGSRLVAQMWRLGVSAPAAERFYAAADACRLERAIRLVARDGRSGAAAEAALAEQLDGATPGTPYGRPPSPRLRLPAPPLPADCAEELAYDTTWLRAPFSPLLWLNDPGRRGVVFWRDPGPARLASLLLTANRPVYRAQIVLPGDAGAAGDAGDAGDAGAAGAAGDAGDARSARAHRFVVTFLPVRNAGPPRQP